MLWKIAIREVIAVHAGDLANLTSVLAPSWKATHDTSDKPAASSVAIEKSFICPNATRLYSEADRELEAQTSDTTDVEAVNVCVSLSLSSLPYPICTNICLGLQEQVYDGRLDMVNYEAQILSLMEKLPILAERHGREIVPIFMNITDTNDEDVDDESGASYATGLKLSRRARQERLSHYLSLFATFGNPKALYRSEDVFQAHLDILSKGENSLQNLALNCLHSYKLPYLVPYEERLKGLLTESKFRDELTKFPLGPDSEVINPEHRPELLPVVIRVLYGIMISKKGRHSSNQGPTIRKNAVLSALGSCVDDDFKTLVDLMLQSFPASVQQTPADMQIDNHDYAQLDSVRGRTQLGYLAMLADVLKHLSTQIVMYWPVLLSVTLSLVSNAQRQIASEPMTRGVDAQENDEEAEEKLEEMGGNVLPSRTIRNAGLRRLAVFFRSPAPFDFQPYMTSLFSEIISPRLALLPQENTQAPSAIMEIISSWSQRPEMYNFLVDYDDRVLSQLFACIGQPKVKAVVVSHVLDVVDRLLRAAEDDDSDLVANKFLAPYMSGLLDNLLEYVKSNAKANISRDDVVKRQISVLPRISPYAQSQEQAQKLVELLVPFLRKPAKQVSENIKTDILATLASTLPKVQAFSDPTSDFYRLNFTVVSLLFRSLRSRPARQALVGVFKVFERANPGLSTVVQVVTDLNAFSTKRMEEPDFDRRLKAFQTIHEMDHQSIDLAYWQPMLYNALFYLQDPEELTVRSNAGEVIKDFVNVHKPHQTTHERESMIVNLVLPGLKDVLRSRHELVRAEAMSVIGHAVEACQGIPVFDEMRPLLANGDTEANFFNNVYHLQVHRRARAYRRLTEFVATNTVRENTIAGIFMPVLGHVIHDVIDKTDHNLINEAITSIGKLAGELGWSKYHASVLQYLRLGTAKGPLQKYYVRATTAILDNFHFDMQMQAVHDPADEQLGDEEAPTIEQQHIARESARIAEYVVNKLLPSLIKFVQQKDETEDSIRIPVALGIVKVAMALPEDARDEEIGRVITALSQILRSKDQDTRDLVRETISKIALVLGPDWLARIIKELRAGLQRGPQLHVLAVVTHAILAFVTTEDPERFSNLDDAVTDIVTVSAEVVWGKSGQDVTSEGFKTKMREVRGANSRGYDNFQLVARLISPNRVNNILVPLKHIMRETSAVKPMQQVDEALHRIASGLNSNALFGPIELLRLCYTLISSSAEFLRPAKSETSESASVKDDYRVQMKRKMVTDDDHYKENAHKFVGFGLDLFVTAFRRGKFDFADSEILGRLAPLVNAIGNALFSKSDSVLTLGMKAAAAITKTPLPSVDAAAPAMIEQIIKIIKRYGGSASSQVCQVAMRSLSVIIRDCKSAVVKEKQLAYLVEIIGPDLDEHETQAPAFALLRAILAKRFVVPEVYDLMEKVASLMVTSQSASVQELCRSAMLQFLLDYPQGKGRLKSTMQFLASNLSYVFESGRVSVMELLSHCFNKFSDELVASYSNLFFLALVIVVANDDSEKCRAMAGELIKLLIQRFDAERMEEHVNTLSKWANQQQEPALVRSSAIVSALTIQCSPEIIEPHIATIVRDLNRILARSAHMLQKVETEEQVSAFDLAELDYALPYQALNTLATCSKQFPTSSKDIQWAHVMAHLLFPHDWVRLASAKLLVSRFNQTGESTPDEAHVVARKCALILSSGGDKGAERNVPNETLCGQVVRLLFSIGKTWVVSYIEHVSNSLHKDSTDVCFFKRLNSRQAQRLRMTRWNRRKRMKAWMTKMPSIWRMLKSKKKHEAMVCHGSCRDCHLSLAVLSSTNLPMPSSSVTL